ncbi:MAG: hypothetical protein AB7K08_01340 [Microbacteriaceae bacterium]
MGDTVLFLADIPAGDRLNTFDLAVEDAPGGHAASEDAATIRQSEPLQSDGFRRFDTGAFEIELCTGKANGRTNGKWGIRFFRPAGRAESLIKDYSNSMGGVFGPYFTPENGLINPPEHAIANATVVDEGPLFAHYRFDVNVPSGLDPQLDGSQIHIDWRFYAGTPWFERTYRISDYSTTIDRMPASNTMTVGDEFESGQGRVLFDGFSASRSTVFRAGDPYSLVLIQAVQDALNSIGGDASPVIEEYRQAMAGGVENESYDFYWKVLCSLEPYLSDETRTRVLDEIVNASHEAVRRDLIEAPLLEQDVAEVRVHPQETIFVRDADKTAMIDSATGDTVVWHTSQVVRRYQIVQRPQSGWVNWGTNGENEFPELPSGSTIRLAFGRFDDWKQQADRLATSVRVELMERE